MTEAVRPPWKQRLWLPQQGQVHEPSALPALTRCGAHTDQGRTPASSIRSPQGALEGAEQSDLHRMPQQEGPKQQNVPFREGNGRGSDSRVAWAAARDRAQARGHRGWWLSLLGPDSPPTTTTPPTGDSRSHLA